MAKKRAKRLTWAEKKALKKKLIDAAIQRIKEEDEHERIVAALQRGPLQPRNPTKGAFGGIDYGFGGKSMVNIQSLAKHHSQMGKLGFTVEEVSKSLASFAKMLSDTAINAATFNKRLDDVAKSIPWEPDGAGVRVQPGHEARASDQEDTASTFSWLSEWSRWASSARRVARRSDVPRVRGRSWCQSFLDDVAEVRRDEVPEGRDPLLHSKDL